MNTFELLEDEACRDGIEVVDHKFSSDRIKGFYYDGTITLNESALSTSAEKACILSEELGHHFTSVGDILDTKKSQCRKQEQQARLWGYDKLIALKGLIRAYEHGCRSIYDVAEFLEVTEEYLQDAVDRYTNKYGAYTKVDGYYIMFIPNLAVMKVV